MNDMPMPYEVSRAVDAWVENFERCGALVEEVVKKENFQFLLKFFDNTGYHTMVFNVMPVQQVEND